jgi:hypothetical protein
MGPSADSRSQLMLVSVHTRSAGSPAPTTIQPRRAATNRTAVAGKGSPTQTPWIARWHCCVCRQQLLQAGCHQGHSRSSYLQPDRSTRSGGAAGARFRPRPARRALLLQLAHPSLDTPQMTPSGAKHVCIAWVLAALQALRSGGLLRVLGRSQNFINWLPCSA